jgi:hypothetical protein
VTGGGAMRQPEMRLGFSVMDLLRNIEGDSPRRGYQQRQTGNQLARQSHPGNAPQLLDYECAQPLIGTHTYFIGAIAEQTNSPPKRCLTI